MGVLLDTLFVSFISFLVYTLKQEYKHQFTVGERLKILRRNHGFNSYKIFAAELAIEPKQYWLLENDRVDFRISSLKRILEYYDMSAHDFFEDVEI